MTMSVHLIGLGRNLRKKLNALHRNVRASGLCLRPE
jgi:hypothetical protein